MYSYSLNNRNGDIGVLSSFGFPDAMIDRWKEDGIKTLLPIQIEAIQHHKLFEGGNLVVSAPTSSGKTLIGELAALKAAIDHQKTLFLVPLKALAEEKYRSFRRQCEPNGIKVAISTRDRKDYDRRLTHSEFDIAVVVYEKFFPLVSSAEQFINQFKLIVVDELQMLTDPNRGALLELILSWIRSLDDGPQIVGLSAVIGNGGVLPDWLGAKFLQSSHRPVELRMGYLHNGVYTYWESNAGGVGEESWFEGLAGDGAAQVVAAVSRLAQRGEQSLVFVRDKDGTRRMAAAIAETLDDSPAKEALAELKTEEETQSRDELVYLLQRGIAYHNADLTPFEREVLERHYRAGRIRVLACTSTLAMGVNLPAKNVFLDWERWRSGQGVKPYLMPLTKGEYSNMGGRAGRLGWNDDFGRAVLIATTELQKAQFTNLYIHSEIEDLKPQLWQTDDLSTAVLQALAIGGGKNVERLRQFLEGTLSWKLEVKSDADAQRLKARFEDGLARCVRLGLIDRLPEEQLLITDLGQKVVGSGIKVGTADALITWLQARGSVKLDVLEILLVAALTEDGRSDGINMSTVEFRARRDSYRASIYEELGADLHRFLFHQLSHLSENYDQIKACKTTLMLFDYINDFDNRELEREYYVYLGAVSRYAEQIGWILEAAAGLSDLLCPRRSNSVELGRLASRVTHGVPTEGIFLARAGLPGLGRERIRSLVRFGVDSIDALQEVERPDLDRLLSQPVAGRLVAWLEERERNAGVPQTLPAQTTEEDHAPKLPPLLTLIGESERRRSSIELNGQRLLLRDREFELLVRLARARMLTPDGWVSKYELNLPDCGITQGISRLRDALGLKKTPLSSEAELIEADYGGNYRLSLTPERLAFQLETLRNHWSSVIQDLCDWE